MTILPSGRNRFNRTDIQSTGYFKIVAELLQIYTPLI